MKKSKYIKPKLYSEVKVSESVETGCCLRSCGGSPYHLGQKSLVPKQAQNQFKKILK